MPILEKSQEQQEYDRQLELEDLARFDAVEAAKRAHELKMADGRHKREVDIARLKHATAPRQIAIARVLVGVIKMPAFFVLAFMLPIVTLRGKDIPPSLERFLEL